MNFKEISTNLPDSFRHDIIYHNEKEKRVNIRSDLKTEEDCKLWIKKFSQATNTNWVIRDVESDSFVFKFCAVYICHLSSYSLKNIDKKDGCSCAITFMIKKTNNRILVNPHIQEGFITLITVSYNHFHSTLVQNESSVFQLGESYFQAFCNERSGYGIDISFETKEIKPKTTEHKLKSILEAFRNKGHIIEIRENPVILVIITPLMQRAQQLPLAKDMAFVDSFPIGSNPSYTVAFMLAHCKVKVIPLVVIIMEGNSRENFLTAFTIAKENFGPYSFCGQGYPYAIMTDNSAEETYVTSTLWPESNSLICRFQILHPVMKWLQDQKDITKAESKKLLNMFNQLVVCDSIVEAEKIYSNCIGASENESAHLAQKYPQWVAYMNSLWLDKEKWCTAYRSYRTRGFHTNNVCKTFVRLYKSFVVSRCQEINICSLLYHTCEVLDHYFGKKLLDVANGRMNSARRMIKKDFKKAELLNKNSIKILDSHTFSVPKENNSEEQYVVNLSLGCCDCSIGKFGAFCEHQAALYLHFQRISPSMPFITPEERYSIAVLALGRYAKNTPYSPPLCEDKTKSYKNLAEVLQSRKHCAAPGCEVRSFNISDDQKKLMENGMILSFHKIPLKNKDTWIAAAKISKQLLQENTYLCSLHFDNFCFNLNNELHEEAVPTLFFDNFSSYVKELLKRNLPYDFNDDDGDSENNLNKFSINLSTSENRNEKLKCDLKSDSQSELNNILFLDVKDPAHRYLIESENEETVGYDVNSPLEDYNGLIACEEIVVAENYESGSDPDGVPSKLNAENCNKTKTLDDLIDILHSMENETLQQSSSMNSFKNVIPRLLNIFEIAKTKQNDASVSPSVYIVADKLDAEETDFERKTVAVSPVEAVFVVNDMLKSFKVGVDNFVNSEDISLLCTNPVIALMKYVTLNNANPSTNCIYIITTEKLQRLMHSKLRKVLKKKDSKKKKEQSTEKKKKKKTKTNRNSQPELPILAENTVHPEILKCRKSKKKLNIDESGNFKTGQKWYISSLSNTSTINQDTSNVDFSLSIEEETNSDSFQLNGIQSDLQNGTKDGEEYELSASANIFSVENENSLMNRDYISFQSENWPDSQIVSKDTEKYDFSPRMGTPITEIESSPLNQDSSSLCLDRYSSLVESIEDLSNEYDDQSDIEQQCSLLSEIKILELETFSEPGSDCFHNIGEIQIPVKPSSKISGIENIVINTELKNVEMKTKKRKLNRNRIMSPAKRRSTKSLKIDLFKKR